MEKVLKLIEQMGGKKIQLESRTRTKGSIFRERERRVEVGPCCSALSNHIPIISCFIYIVAH